MTAAMEPSNEGGAGALTPAGSAAAPARGAETTNLADVLERVLDKGIVIAGDIQINLLDIELLTIKLRLIVAGVDTARRMGIDWWESDPWLAGRQAEDDQRSLRERIDRLERQLEAPSNSGGDRGLEGENDALREQVVRLQRELEQTTTAREAEND
jgi:hypothetical protein